MMKKRMTAGMLATLMAAVLPVSACAAQNSAPQPQLNTAEHMQYMNGYTDGTFGPERSMSRSEAAAIFARLLSDRLDERIPSFTDLKPGSEDFYIVTLPQEQTMEQFCAAAKARSEAKEGIAYLPSYVDRVLASMSAGAAVVAAAQAGESFATKDYGTKVVVL